MADPKEEKGVTIITMLECLIMLESWTDHRLYFHEWLDESLRSCVPVELHAQDGRPQLEPTNLI